MGRNEDGTVTAKEAQAAVDLLVRYFRKLGLEPVHQMGMGPKEPALPPVIPLPVKVAHPHDPRAMQFGNWTRLGYAFKNEGVCKKCDAAIEWWVAGAPESGQAKWIPLNPRDLTKHFGTCSSQ